MRRFPKVCVAVLAAGALVRMGAPKLLLPFAGSTLLERAVDAALGSAADEVCVVTGARHAEMACLLGASLRGGEEDASNDCAAGSTRLTLVRNEAWENGQASSVRAAARFAERQGADALIVMVADQPFVGATHLNALMWEYDQGRAQAYLAATDHGHGNPCLFDRSLFGDLLSMEGDEGARALFRSRRDIAARHVYFDDGRIFKDADTPTDFARLEREVLYG